MFAINQGHHQCTSETCNHTSFLEMLSGLSGNKQQKPNIPPPSIPHPDDQSSRSLQASTATLKPVLEAHDDHFHARWAGETQIRKRDGQELAKLYTQEGEEGCPCCTAGLDFDEFAVAIKEMMGNVEGQHELVEAAEFSSGADWAVFLGISAPLSLLGLTAAIRNIGGCLKNRKTIAALIDGLDKAIEKNKSKPEVTKRLEAFRETLRYSKFDTDFNLVVPGVVNGAASSLVLSSALLSHPFALPAIGLYATSQLGRNLYDLKRVVRTNVAQLETDTPEITIGKSKVNQVTQSKTNFYLANALGFAAFATGAALTFLSLPALGIPGLGAAALWIGISTLGAGAIFTGVTNNIWPRKFRPRNGDLGVDRANLDEASCLQEISLRKQLKTRLKNLKNDYAVGGKWTRFNYMARSAMPQFKDFLPQKVATPVSNFFSFLPRTGSSAVAHLHELEKQRMLELHADENDSVTKIRHRNSALLAMRTDKGDPQDYCPIIRSENDIKEQLLGTWEHLQWLGLGEAAICTYMNEGFHNGLTGAADCGDTSDQTKTKKKNDTILGLEEKQDSFTWSMERFLSSAKTHDIQRLNAAIDFFLTNTLLGKLTYEQYGLIDFFHALRSKVIKPKAYKQTSRTPTGNLREPLQPSRLQASSSAEELPPAAPLTESRQPPARPKVLTPEEFSKQTIASILKVQNAPRAPLSKPPSLAASAKPKHKAPKTKPATGPSSILTHKSSTALAAPPPPKSTQDSIAFMQSEQALPPSGTKRKVQSAPPTRAAKTTRVTKAKTTRQPLRALSSNEVNISSAKRPTANLATHFQQHWNVLSPQVPWSPNQIFKGNPVVIKVSCKQQSPAGSYNVKIPGPISAKELQSNQLPKAALVIEESLRSAGITGFSKVKCSPEKKSITYRDVQFGRGRGQLGRAIQASGASELVLQSNGRAEIRNPRFVDSKRSEQTITSDYFKRTTASPDAQQKLASLFPKHASGKHKSLADTLLRLVERFEAEQAAA